jgi:hypothetical protein
VRASQMRAQRALEALEPQRRAENGPAVHAGVPDQPTPGP